MPYPSTADPIRIDAADMDEIRRSHVEQEMLGVLGATLVRCMDRRAVVAESRSPCPQRSFSVYSCGVLDDGSLEAGCLFT